MPIRFRCDCGQALGVKDELAGRRVRCPACEGVLTVPANEETSGVRPDEPEERRSAVRSEPARRPPPLRDAEDWEGPRRRREEDDDRPRRPRSGDVDNYPRPRVRRRVEGGSGEGPMNTILGGAIVMGIAVVWFVAGLFFDWVFFYPPILFVAGLITLCQGLYQLTR
jgi:hypothetical protein